MLVNALLHLPIHHPDAYLPQQEPSLRARSVLVSNTQRMQKIATTVPFLGMQAALPVCLNRQGPAAHQTFNESGHLCMRAWPCPILASRLKTMHNTKDWNPSI